MAAGERKDIQLVLAFDDQGSAQIKTVIDSTEKSLDGLAQVAGKTSTAVGPGISSSSVQAISGLDKLKQSVLQHGTQWDTLGKKVSDAGRNLTLTMGALLGGAILSTRKIIEFGDSMHDLSQKTGVGTEMLSTFKLSAEKSGTSLNGVAFALRYLSRDLMAAQKSGKSTSNMFSEMGVETKDSSGKLRDLDAVFYDVAESISKMDDGAEKTALAMKIFGRSGMELIPMLNLGSAGLKENADMARKLGMIMSQETAKAADEFNDTLAELSGAGRSTFQMIATTILPTLSKLINHIRDAIVAFKDFTREHEGLIGGFLKFAATAVVLVTMLSPVMLLIGKLIQGFSMLAPIVVGAGTKIMEVVRTFTTANATLTTLNGTVLATNMTSMALGTRLMSLANAFPLLTAGVVALAGYGLSILIRKFLDLIGVLPAVDTALSNFFDEVFSGGWDQIKKQNDAIADAGKKTIAVVAAYKSDNVLVLAAAFKLTGKEVKTVDEAIALLGARYIKTGTTGNAATDEMMKHWVGQQEAVQGFGTTTKSVFDQVYDGFGTIDSRAKEFQGTLDSLSSNFMFTLLAKIQDLDPAWKAAHQSVAEFFETMSEGAKKIATEGGFVDSKAIEQQIKDFEAAVTLIKKTGTDADVFSLLGTQIAEFLKKSKPAMDFFNMGTPEIAKWGRAVEDAGEKWSVSAGLISRTDINKNFKNVAEGMAEANKAGLSYSDTMRIMGPGIAEVGDKTIKLAEMMGIVIPKAFRDAVEGAKSWNAAMAIADKFKPKTADDVRNAIAGLGIAMQESTKKGINLNQFVQQNSKEIVAWNTEWQPLLKLFGIDLPPAMKAAVAAAQELEANIKNAFVPTMIMLPDIITGMMIRLKAGLKAKFNIVSPEEDIKNIQRIGVAFMLLGKTMDVASWKTTFDDMLKSLSNINGITTDQACAQFQKLYDIIRGIYNMMGIPLPPLNFAAITAKSTTAAATVKKDWTTAFSVISAVMMAASDHMSAGWKAVTVSVATGIEALGTKIAGLAAGAKLSMQDIADVAKAPAGAIGGMIGGAISGKKDNLSGTGSALGGSVGALFGPVGAIAGSLLGGLIGGLFSSKPAKTAEQKAAEQMANQVKEATQAMSKYGVISDATAKAIAEDRKTMSGAAAEAKNFAKVIADVGVNQKNVNDLWKGSGGAIDLYKQGLMDAATATKATGDNFTAMLAGAQALGTEGSKAMSDFINKTQASGLKVKEVTDYINNQLGVVKKGSMSASDGLLAMAKAPNQTVESMGRLERQAMATFNAMIKNGASYSEAMDALGPTLDQLDVNYKKLKMTAGSGIDELMAIRNVTSANKELFDAISGNLGVMNALANTGSLTQQTFTDSTTQASEFYNQLTTAGLTGNQALAQMAPTLERIRYLAKEHGLAIDDATQSLIKQAGEQGLLKDEELSTNDTMLAGFGAIVKALGGAIPAAMQTAMDKMNELGKSGSDAADTVANGTQLSVDKLGLMTTAVGNIGGAFDRLGAKGGSVISGLANAAMSAVGNMGALQKATYGSGVGGALERVGELAPKTFDTLTTKVAEAREGTDKLQKSLIDAANVHSVKLGDDLAAIAKTSDDMSTRVADGFSTIGDQAAGAQKRIHDLTQAMADGDGMRVGVGVEVVKPIQTTSASAASEVDRSKAIQDQEKMRDLMAQQLEATKAGANIAIEPIVIEKDDKRIISFIRTQYGSGNWKIPATSVEGS